MNRTNALAYGCFCYVVFLFTFVYAIGFVGNLIVPKAIDGAPKVPLGQALFTNAMLLTIFALQHSVMARPAFKAWWKQFVPVEIERSTYVLFSSLALIILFIFWEPVGRFIWDIDQPIIKGILWTGFGFGWLLVLVSTFLINHFDLFGLRQVWLFYKEKPYTHLRFSTPGLYQWVRHPLYVGWIFAFWCTPTMTVTHLVFALATTAYILIAIQFEERDLVKFHGEDYENYRRRVPMLIPLSRKKSVGR